MNDPLTTPIIPRELIAQVRQAAQSAPPANRVSLIELISQTWPDVEHLVIELGYDVEGLRSLYAPLCQQHKVTLSESDFIKTLKRAAAKTRGRRVLRRLGVLSKQPMAPA